MRSDSKRYPKANPISVEGLIRPAVARIGCGPEIILDILRKNWGTVVGEANAKKSEPTAILDGTLTIVVPSPIWMTQARFMKSSFLETINRFLSPRGAEIRDITFALTPRSRSIP